LHTFPVHRSLHCFFKTSVSRVLQVVVEPQNRTLL
jgi:hypothetical protein